ncbi:MAG: helix-turn-helix domain-containing protein [Thermoguttaceae bacterium]
METLNAYSNIRVLQLPSFPAPAEESASRLKASLFSPEDLLGGILIGSENRLMELAFRLAVDGVPLFDRPLGTSSLDSSLHKRFEATRADVEFMLTATSAGKIDRLFQKARPLCSEGSSLQEEYPRVISYNKLESCSFLTPLVFYGPTGTGKTKIIEGICQSRRTLEPQKTLYNLSALEFSRALVDALRRDQMQLFRSLFAQARVIAIEDADLLAEKESVQHEFLPLLDEAILSQKLLILSFSKNPASIRGFIPDLAARFSSGLLIPTSFPSPETRRYVVSQLSQKFSLALDPRVVDLCVEKLPSTIGAICSSILQGVQEAALARTPLTIDFWDAFLTRRNPKATWTLERILKTVARYFAVSVVELRSKKRTKSLVQARQCVVFLARRLTNATFQEIGRLFSNRDHSTMTHASNELEEALAKDAELRFHLKEIATLLQAQDTLSL